MDRTSFRYRFDRALAWGQRLPEPQNEEERRYRDRRLRDQDKKRKRAEAEHAAAMARPVVTLDVEWSSDGSLLDVSGTCSHSEVTGALRLVRKRRDVGSPLLSFAAPVVVLQGRPWTLAGQLMPNPLRKIEVPVSEGWDHAERVAGATAFAQILASEVPEAVTDPIFERFGIPPHGVLEEWTRIGGARRKEMQAAWEADWAERHGRPYSRGGGDGPARREGAESGAVPSEEPTRDDRIAAAMRSYSGPRTKRQGWPYLRNLRRHAGIPISASDRARVWRTLRKSQ